jgi:hypothetical protein
MLDLVRFKAKSCKSSLATILKFKTSPDLPRNIMPNLLSLESETKPSAKIKSSAFFFSALQPEARRTFLAFRNVDRM